MKHLIYISLLVVCFLGCYCTPALTFRTYQFSSHAHEVLRLGSIQIFVAVSSATEANRWIRVGIGLSLVTMLAYWDYTRRPLFEEGELLRIKGEPIQGELLPPIRAIPVAEDAGPRKLQ